MDRNAAMITKKVAIAHRYGVGSRNRLVFLVWTLNVIGYLSIRDQIYNAIIALR